MLVINAEVGGEIMQVRCAQDEIAEIARALPLHSGEECLDAQGGALLRGLHDHHLHLFSLAAALASAACGPPEVESAEDLAACLAEATPQNGWVRGTGYFESVAGPLDRDRLDELAPPLPVRIQHRSGAMWFLNSRALSALGLENTRAPREAPEGVELDAQGRPTGRLFRSDAWLRERLPATSPPDLTAVGELLARFGVTGVTDATPSNGPEEWTLFDQAQISGALPQRLRVMGNAALGTGTAQGTVEHEDGALSTSGQSKERLSVDARKILLDEPALPSLDALVAAIREAHTLGRGVAIHTVTRAEILFALAAIESAGVGPGDRLEHASIAPPEAMETIERLGIRIITQPNFVAERGDAYQQNVAKIDQPHLYKVQSWIDRAVPLALATDAPFGHPDPWRAMRAAVDRKTPSGAQLSPEECVSPDTALALFDPERIRATGPGQALPGEGVRIPRPGDPADLCLLRLPWASARTRLRAEDVRATICGGQIVYLNPS